MITELRHFLLVVEHGTFTEAARRAHLTQPALSASMRRLEEHFGAALLHRGRGGAEVTAAGEALIPRARATLAALSEAERAVSEVAGLRAGEVRVGAGATACTYLLPPYIKRFREQHPGIRVKLREGLGEHIADAVDAGELDLAVVRNDAGEAWKHDSLILVSAPGVDPRGAPFVTFPRGASTREILDRVFPEAEVVMELSSIATVKGHVRAGVGVALLSRHAVETDLAQGRLVEVEHARTPVRTVLSLVHRGVERLPPAAAALREMLLKDRDRISPRRPRER
jgi:DNA-binding transcriptional LysR family regulator